MNWLTELPATQPTAWAVLVLMIVAVAGFMLAQIKIKGIGLGVTGVLFAGIIAGHFGLHIDEEILEFVRDFGLVLFVFTIGLQLGPGFFAAFRKQGLVLNFLSLAIVLLGAGVTIGAGRLLNVNSFASLGLFSGATTNTPSLGATQLMLKTMGGNFGRNVDAPALAYAVAYPGAVAGIIGVILFLRFVCGGKSRQPQTPQKEPEHVDRISLLVENSTGENMSIGDIHARYGVVISRIKKNGSGEIQTAEEHMPLHKGDVVLAVGTRAALQKFREATGCESEISLLHAPGKIISQRMVVTRPEVLGKTLKELKFSERFGIIVTRVARGDVEMTAMNDLQLHFGDILQVVGTEQALADAAKLLGDRIHAVHETNFMPIFVGIALGVLVGAIPIIVPSVPVPVHMGMAGGPLIMAIILSRIGRIGPLVWYMPASANIAFRELGITLFLACVGLKAGGNFFETVFTNIGLHWFLAGLAITIIPLLLVALFARFVLRLDVSAVNGVLAGSMTDPPALAFAHSMSASDAPLVAYAAVYPLTMLLRIFTAQVLVVILCR